MQFWVSAGLLSLTMVCLPAADINGFIVIKRKLTKPNVTLSASSYQRGVAVKLGDTGEPLDPISLERSRVVIYLEGHMASKPLTVTMEQKGRRFLPDTVVAPVGSTVSFPNLDPIFHNVFSVSPAKRFDLGKYPRPESKSVRFDKPGVVNVYCDIHADMNAWIVVLPNRAFARPDASGHYRLPELPAGRYKLRWWHPDFAGGEREVTVSASGDVTADVEF